MSEQSVATDEIRKASEGFYQAHNTAVAERDVAEAIYDKTKPQLGELSDLQAGEVQAADLSDDTRYAAGYSADKLSREVKWKRDVVNGAVERSHAYDIERRAALWDGRDHLEHNREVYEQAAVEDANAAGHDVQFSGEQHLAPRDLTSK